MSNPILDPAPPATVCCVCGGAVQSANLCRECIERGLQWAARQSLAMRHLQDKASAPGGQRQSYGASGDSGFDAE